MPPKKGKGKVPPASAKAAAASGPPPKPKKIPPPPACFGPEDLAKFKELFKACDEENIDKVSNNIMKNPDLFKVYLSYKYFNKSENK